MTLAERIVEAILDPEESGMIELSPEQFDQEYGEYIRKNFKADSPRAFTARDDQGKQVVVSRGKLSPYRRGHEGVHIAQAARRKPTWKFRQRTSEKDYLSNTQELMARARDLADDLLFLTSNDKNLALQALRGGLEGVGDLARKVWSDWRNPTASKMRLSTERDYGKSYRYLSKLPKEVSNRLLSYTYQYLLRMKGHS